MKTEFGIKSIGELLRLERRVIDVEPMSTYQLIGVYSFGKGIFHREPTLGADLGAYRFSTINDGDLVLSNIQAWEGAIAVAGPQDNGCIGTHRFLTYVPIDDGTDIEYLCHYLLSERGMELIRKASPGSIVRNRTLGIKAFESLLIPLPPIDVQRRIAARIDALGSRRSTIAAQTARYSSDFVLSMLPGLVQEVFDRRTVDHRSVATLADFVSDTVHPGEDPGKAAQFVGLQHVESHSGRRLGGMPVGEEKGRKFRFRPGDIVYGYLRPYLNKAWVADRHGLCSVDQYVLRPKIGVSPVLLAHGLRARSTLDEAIGLTHSLQLPRLRSSLLAAIEVPVVTRRQSSAERQLDKLVEQVCEAADLRSRQLKLVTALQPAVLNEAFAEIA